MISHQSGSLPTPRAMCVERFGEVPTKTTPLTPSRISSGRALVRITHASVGATDATAVRGEYLMQPLPRFVPGYDFIGTVERLAATRHSHLSVGQRVAGILPRMGAHSTFVTVPPSLLVPVPADLDSAVAATVALDALTARFALDALNVGHGPVLVQGAGGAVGSWAVQMAAARGYIVFGTASSRSGRHAEGLGASVLDYRDPAWIDELIDATDGGVAGAIDQTGSRSVRRAVRTDGRIVRIAFDAEPGRRRLATAKGFAAATLRRYAGPSERVCSIPVLVTARRAAYRRALAQVFADLTTGALTPPGVCEYPFDDYTGALAAAQGSEPGRKVVLAMA